MQDTVLDDIRHHLETLFTFGMEMQPSIQAVTSPNHNDVWTALCYALSVELGGTISQATKIATVVHLVHRASALLDDLQDEDSSPHLTLSSGQITNVAVALLAGAFLYDFKTLNPDAVLRAYSTVANSVVQMAIGQNQELSTVGSPSLEAYEETVALKTGTFSALACSLPAVFLSAPESVTLALQKVGRLLGLLYQVSNDFNGFMREDSNNDLHRHWTWPTIYAFTVGGATEREQLRVAWCQHDSKTVRDTTMQLGALQFLGVLTSRYLVQMTEQMAILEEANISVQAIHELARQVSLFDMAPS